VAAKAGTRHTVVKVCGITRLGDARAALEAGADWLGFILWEGSPRRVDPERAAEIVAASRAPVSVAVMVRPTPDEAAALASRIGAARVQLHEVDALDWPADFPLAVTFAIPVSPQGTLERPLPRSGPLVMLDASDRRKVGGTGQRIPWESARVVAATRDVLLAGGLDAECVGEALDQVRPFGVDAASGLEREPGIKDPDKVRRFVAAVRAFDAAL